MYEVLEYRSELELVKSNSEYELKLSEYKSNEKARDDKLKRVSTVLRNTIAENQRIKDEIYHLTESMNQRKLVTNSTATFIPIYDPRKLFPK
jgi:hypothetical protein